jgi:hypothetical protein
MLSAPSAFLAHSSSGPLSSSTTPFTGVVALLLVFSGIALANTTLALQHAWISGPSWGDTAASMLMGSLGIALVWRGLRAGDARGSFLGYAGGSLIWMGYFEWTWLNFAQWLGVDMLVIDGVPVLPPTMLLVQASSLIFFPLVLLTAANKDTRCRMMLWIRRRLGLKTGSPTPGHRHQAARVTATETLFIIWFVYLLTIAVYDPRLLGRGDLVSALAIGALTLWGIYLLGRLLKISSPGAAIRYAIPTGYLLTMPVDALAQRGWFPAVWIKPLEYPLAAIVALSIFALAAVVLTRRAHPAAALDSTQRSAPRMRRILAVSGSNARMPQ